MVVEDACFYLPDIITYLQNETNLTRRTIVDILKQLKRLADFKNNPQMFMDEVSSIIRRKMKYLLVGGVKYETLGEDEELYGYLSKNMIESEKSVYEYVVYDSGVEEEFAKKFEKIIALKFMPNYQIGSKLILRLEVTILIGQFGLETIMKKNCTL
ncbi:hypothetical protein KPL35_12955 [Clostridium sp. CF011]|uniref:hypothetical protein n=1 Tax=Clostridium sp. CF011 TaxID=2843318 RepID=UPI001C0A9895|nr:hypothetical protein [Clostridium sp. CF011]MBU3092981.1 hypothetical protein [Clostridium sp. CF011]WAG70349.1 hypothetical protein LL036_02580 [Clostridium sp. CF011]